MKKNFILTLCFLFSTSVFYLAHGQNNNGNISVDPLVSHIDSAVNPGNDFFLFANSRWFKQNPIPASEPYNGIFQLIQDTINAQIHNICVSSAAITHAVKGSNKQKIGDFFFSGMDSVTLNNKGISGLKADFKAIDAIRDINGVAKEASYIHSISGSPLFSFWITQDDRISSKNAIFIGQGGLSLPNRDYYFDTDDRAVMIREKFTDYLTHMFAIMGYNQVQSKQAASRLMKLETALAKSSRKPEDTRDPLKNYNKISFASLCK